MNVQEALCNLHHHESKIVLQTLKMIARNAAKTPELFRDAIDVIAGKLHDADDTICAYACWTAGQLGFQRPAWYHAHLPQLFWLLTHPNDEVRANALFALGRIGRQQPEFVQSRIAEIVNMASDPAPNVRMNMIWASENIAQTRPDVFQPYLAVYEALLDDPDARYVRGEAPEFFRVIGKTHPEWLLASIPKLREKLTDTHPVTRIHAQGALRRIAKTQQERQAKAKNANKTSCG